MMWRMWLALTLGLLLSVGLVVVERRFWSLMVEAGKANRLRFFYGQLVKFLVFSVLSYGYLALERVYGFVYVCGIMMGVSVVKYGGGLLWQRQQL